MLSWLRLQSPLLLLPFFLRVVSFLQPGPLHPVTLPLPLPPLQLVPLMLLLSAKLLRHLLL